MSGGLGLEQRYRRVLRLLPGYYRDKWEEDMVAAFLDSWHSGDPDDDEWALEFCKPTWGEVGSVAALAARLYLGGAATPRRYFAWGQARAARMHNSPEKSGSQAALPVASSASTGTYTSR